MQYNFMIGELLLLEGYGRSHVTFIFIFKLNKVILVSTSDSNLQESVGGVPFFFNIK